MTEHMMSAVKLSSKFQVVIPKPLRDDLHLHPGQRIEIFKYGDRLELVPIQPMRRLRGFLKGLDTSVPRAPDRV
jgi:AbrB family looped-hinge helix DNA binding protein